MPRARARCRRRLRRSSLAPRWRGTTDAWIRRRATLGLAFALLVQIGTNFANDYYDFVKGADNAARVGPRRAVAAGLIAPATMRRAIMGGFRGGVCQRTWARPVGRIRCFPPGWVASILCGFAYTGGPWPLGYHGLGDIFVFIFFRTRRRRWDLLCASGTRDDGRLARRHSHRPADGKYSGREQLSRRRNRCCRRQAHARGTLRPRVCARAVRRLARRGAGDAAGFFPARAFGVVSAACA